MYSCPERQVPVTKSALSSTSCQEVVWNKGSQKYLCQGTLNGKCWLILGAQRQYCQLIIFTLIVWIMLIQRKFCACMEISQLSNSRGRGQWSQNARVVVAPGILVPVLLGTDIYDLSQCWKWVGWPGQSCPGHLDHFFAGSSRSHLQNKLSGCDLDI